MFHRRKKGGQPRKERRKRRMKGFQRKEMEGKQDGHNK